MNRCRVQGFSLIELLITLSIVAILASITVPSFNGFLAKSRRGDAMVALLSLQLAQESYRTGHPVYAPDLAALGWRSASSPNGYYQLQLRQSGGADFLAVAQPVGMQRSDSCGEFAMDAQGPNYSGGFAGKSCWGR